MYKVSPDGAGKARISDDNASKLRDAVDAWIYYELEDGAIFRVKSDGSIRQRVGSGDIGLFKVEGEWLYFHNESDDQKLFKMKMDGEEEYIKICEDNVSLRCVYDDWIYYLFDDGLHRMKADGTNQAKIYDDDVFILNIDGDWIFSRQGYYYGGIYYKMKTDGTERQRIPRSEYEAIPKLTAEWY